MIYGPLIGYQARVAQCAHVFDSTYHNFDRCHNWLLCNVCKQSIDSYSMSYFTFGSKLRKKYPITSLGERSGLERLRCEEPSRSAVANSLTPKHTQFAFVIFWEISPTPCTYWKVCNVSRGCFKGHSRVKKRGAKNHNKRPMPLFDCDRCLFSYVLNW